MGVLDRVFGREATVGQLEQQLTNARAAHAAAASAVAAAQEVFDDAGSDSAARAVGKAREGQQLSREHLERAERLLAAGRERDAQARLEGLRSERDSLLASIGIPAVEKEEAQLVAKEVDLLVALVKVRCERAELRRQAGRRRQRLQEVVSELGEAPVELSDLSRFGTPGGAAPVRLALERRARTLDAQSDEAALLLTARPDGDAYSESLGRVLIERLGAR